MQPYTVCIASWKYIYVGKFSPLTEVFHTAHYGTPQLVEKQCCVTLREMLLISSVLLIAVHTQPV